PGSIGADTGIDGWRASTTTAATTATSIRVEFRFRRRLSASSSTKTLIVSTGSARPGQLADGSVAIDLNAHDWRLRGLRALARCAPAPALKQRAHEVGACEDDEPRQQEIE